jgi:hypothetical protein
VAAGVGIVQAQRVALADTPAQPGQAAVICCRRPEAGGEGIRGGGVVHGAVRVVRLRHGETPRGTRCVHPSFAHGREFAHGIHE